MDNGTYTERQYFECKTNAWEGTNMDIDFVNSKLYIMDLCPNLQVFVTDLNTLTVQSKPVNLSAVYEIFYYDPDTPVPPPVPPVVPPVSPPTHTCNDLNCVHGVCLDNVCRCSVGWTGPTCNISTCLQCWRGTCFNASCVCMTGWTGIYCDTMNFNDTDDIVYYATTGITSFIGFTFISSKFILGGFKHITHNCLILLINIQLQFVPSAVNVYIRNTVNTVYQPLISTAFFGPFEFGYYGFGGFLTTAAGLFVVIIILMIIIRYTPFAGFKYFRGSRLVITEGFCITIVLATSVPLWTKLLYPTLYFSIQNNDIFFGYLYAAAVSVVLIFIIAIIYRFWLSEIFHQYKEFLPTTGRGWNHFFKYIPNSSLKIDDEDEKCTFCIPLFKRHFTGCGFCNPEIHNTDYNKKFVEKYGPLVESYACYRKPSMTVRRYISHRFIMIALFRNLAFVLITFLTWKETYSFFYLAGWEIIYLVVICSLMPFHQRRYFIQQVVLSLILIGQMIATYFFVMEPTLLFLIILTTVPAGLTIFATFLIPVIATKISGDFSPLEGLGVQTSETSTLLLKKDSD